MAKQRNLKEKTMEPENTEVETVAATETVESVTDTPQVADAAAPAALEEPKADERYKFVTHPDTGLQVKRKDFIHEMWTVRKMTRGAIAKLLTEITGKKVPYQIVFASTKDIPGGPVREAATAAPATTEAPTA